MTDQVLPDTTPEVDNVGAHDPVIHQVVAVLISYKKIRVTVKAESATAMANAWTRKEEGACPTLTSYRLGIDKDERSLLAANVNVVAR